MQGFPFAYHLGSLADRGTQQFTGDGITCGLESCHQGRPARQ